MVPFGVPGGSLPPSALIFGIGDGAGDLLYGMTWSLIHTVPFCFVVR
jgi:hypothetical protein